ncbi:MAG: DNA N-6-adenine-methyltransferase [Candidatus Hodarchaeota archaeon]
MSLSSHQNTVGKSNNWFTPPYIFEKLGKFDLDPCTSKVRPWDIAENNLTSDGLAARWWGRVWMNPPFDRYEVGKWMAKMADHNNGIMLVAARTETRSFYDYVWGRCSGVLFIKGRPHFYDGEGVPAKLNSGAPICLVAYADYNLHMLLKSNLGTVVKEVR